MKPSKIVLVRHGESTSNVDKNVHLTTPDHLIPLTAKGWEQATTVGEKIRTDIFNTFDTPIRFYRSPYLRARQTLEGILKSFDSVKISIREDPRIREQDWGHLYDKKDREKIRNERNEYGTFFYRLPDGESGADVYDRMSTFFESLFRDFNRPDFNNDVILITHGLALRIFLMRWFHWSVETFEKLKNPGNCQFVTMEKSNGDFYKINSKLSTYKIIMSQ